MGLKLKPADVKALAKKIFQEVEHDLRDRRGIKHEWNQVDDEVQAEIRETNEKRIARQIGGVLGVKT